MNDLIQPLKAETGLEEKQVEGGLGAILQFLKGKLPPELYALIEQHIPQAESLIQSLRTTEGQAGGGGGLLGSITDLAGKFLGGKGGDLADLLGSLSKLGLSMDQIKEFVPKAVAMLRQVIPDDVFQKIVERLPALAEYLKDAPAKGPAEV
jgi:hypothetical protein